MIDRGLISKIKDKVDIVGEISKKVSLKRRGIEFIGLSPFSNEKTPSFTVNKKKGFYHCFSTGRHGDVIDFVMSAYNLPFYLAVKKICYDNSIDLEGVDLKDFKSNHDISKCLESAVSFFCSNLMSGSGSEARTYLRSRGVSIDSCKKFKIGYSPNSFSETHEHLLSSGHSIEDIEQAGLLIKSEDDRIWDKFRGRIMFPVFNSYGS